MAIKILTPDVMKDLRESFKHLKGDVALSVFTAKGQNDPHNALARQLVEEFAEAEPRLKPAFHEIGGAEAKRLGVDRSPTIMVGPDKYDIRFMGVPLGEEGQSFVMALIMASTGKGFWDEGSMKAIAPLRDKRHVRVFVSPT